MKHLVLAVLLTLAGASVATPAQKEIKIRPGSAIARVSETTYVRFTPDKPKDLKCSIISENEEGTLFDCGKMMQKIQILVVKPIDDEPADVNLLTAQRR